MRSGTTRGERERERERERGEGGCVWVDRKVEKIAC